MSNQTLMNVKQIQQQLIELNNIKISKKYNKYRKYGMYIIHQAQNKYKEKNKFIIVGRYSSSTPSIDRRNIIYFKRYV